MSGVRQANVSEFVSDLVSDLGYPGRYPKAAKTPFFTVFARVFGYRFFLFPPSPLI